MLPSETQASQHRDKNSLEARSTHSVRCNEEENIKTCEQVHNETHVCKNPTPN